MYVATEKKYLNEDLQKVFDEIATLIKSARR